MGNHDNGQRNVEVSATGKHAFDVWIMLGDLELLRLAASTPDTPAVNAVPARTVTLENSRRSKYVGSLFIVVLGGEESIGAESYARHVDFAGHM